MTVSATALVGLGEIDAGADLAAAIAGAVAPPLDPPALRDEDVIVIAHKVVSKAEGRIRALRDVAAGERAVALANELGKDPRHVQVVLDESAEVLRAARGVLICVTRNGFVCANAGVDASNVPGEDTVLMLPEDPDRSARAVRARLRELTGAGPGIVITDSFGRAWRHGQVDVAIGCAGLSALEDWRGRTDSQERELRATWIAIADELAAAADLVRTKDGGQPVVLIRGAQRHVTVDDGPGAAALVRPESEDLFR
jgi:coenzyme F420-0:L-glutamate ligase / coenzyme F420-1:gamma-L-glutamate ligase